MQIKENLPIKLDNKDTKTRKKMFDNFDVNRNGYLSLAEIDKGFLDMGPSMKIVYESKQVLLRAFQSAKVHFKDDPSDIGDEFVQQQEFRILLLYIRQYF